MKRCCGRNDKGVGRNKATAQFRQSGGVIAKLPELRGLVPAYLLAILIALLCSTAAGANAATAPRIKPAVCRVWNQLAGCRNVGSGTLVDKTDDGRQGLVLTCAHLFREGAGSIVVEFADGKTHGAKLVAIDRQADLAALAVANPSARPAEVSFSVAKRAQLRACGFGSDNTYRCAVGLNIGQAENSGQMSLLVDDAVRSGDSGGGVFDDEGRLVAVVWGAAEGVTYASCGQPLRRFLGRVLGQRQAVVQSCPNGVCPRPQRPQLKPVPQQPLDPGSDEHSIVADQRLQELSERLDRLAETKQDRGEYVTRDELAKRYAALVEQFRAKKQARDGGGFESLRFNTPTILALVAVATIAVGVLARRRFKAQRPPTAVPASAEPHEPTEDPAADAAHTFQETRQPIERDDAEARQLLRLSQLEGRDPLQDAVAGRIALDRLDATADGDADSPQARWADELRRELRERFNDIAPTKFEVAGDRGQETQPPVGNAVPGVP